MKAAGQLLSLAAPMAALVLAACGSDDKAGGTSGGIDRSSPEAVAEAFVESYYKCGKNGAGVRAELTYPPTGDDAADYREDAKEEALPGKCQEKPVDEIITALVPSREAGIPAVVEVSNKECSAGEVPMIQADGKWYVDETEVEGSLICT